MTMLWFDVSVVCVASTVDTKMAMKDNIDTIQTTIEVVSNCESVASTTGVS